MNIISVNTGVTRCYVIQDKGCILVDSGMPKQADTFSKAIREAGIDPRQIGLIVHTHGHYDHIGSANELQRITGAQVAVHERDREYFENATTRKLNGVNVWGGILARLSSGVKMPKIDSTQIDIVFGDDEYSLEPFGIDGKVLYTPGHTMGSVSVLLHTGDAFVGDLAMSGFPLRLRPGLAVFAEDVNLLKKSWNLLLEQGVKEIYPGHGKPFSVDRMSDKV